MKLQLFKIHILIYLHFRNSSWLRVFIRCKKLRLVVTNLGFEIEGLCLDQSHAKYEHRLVEDTVSNVFFYIEIGHLE